MILDDTNSMARLPTVWMKDHEFSRFGYYGYAIRELHVLSTSCARRGCRRDAPLARQPVGGGGYDVVVNGAFFDGSTPLSPVVRYGQLDADVNTVTPKVAYRGGVAVLQDGTVVVARLQGLGGNAVFARFHDRLHAFLGGGGMLVEAGQSVGLADIQNTQQFSATLRTAQFRSTNHTVVGVRRGQAYVLVNFKAKHGEELQQDLVKMGFGAAVKFDGGGGLYFRTAKGEPLQNHDNPSGFGIRVR